MLWYPLFVAGTSVNRIPNFVLIGLLLLCFGTTCARSASAQSAEKTAAKDNVILEIGAAASRSITDALWSLGPTVAVEVTPIEGRLELEAGITPLFASNATEWDTDLLFKKPWALSRKVEFMVGAGPEWIHARERNVVTNSAAAEAVLDFMFWPSPKRKFGWYLEPAYEYSFRRGSEQSLGISGGLLIPIR